MRLLILAILLVWVSSASGETKVFEERRALCLQCHGVNGVSKTPEVPSLGGIPEYYALLQLVEFREGNRKVPIMNVMTKDMTDDDLRAAAAFVAEQPPPKLPAKPGDPARMARGRSLAEQHRCGICHSADFRGGEQMPPLARQREDYLLKALRDYKRETRIGLRAAMAEVLYPLGDAELSDLAHFLAHVPQAGN